MPSPVARCTRAARPAARAFVAAALGLSACAEPATAPRPTTLASARPALAAAAAGGNTLLAWDEADDQIHAVTLDAQGRPGTPQVLGGGSIPAVSPDGLRIAFQDRDVNDPLNSVALFIMDADGGNVRLVPDTHGAAESSWSPDGRRLAVTRTIVDDDRNLFDDVYIVNADGSGSRRLTTTGTAAGRPAWSPAGDRIAYTDRDVTSGDLDIYVLSADGPGAPVNLTNNDDSDFAPAWSPDGSRIAFNASRSGAEGIYVMNAADGTRQTAVTNGSDVSPAWSPDGGRLAFMRFVDGLPDLFLVDAAPPAAGTLATPVNLTNSPTVREQFPSWGGAAGPRYAFGGFRAPVDPAPAVNVAKAGSAIPVKFSLGADYGLAIFKPGYPRFTSSVCGGGTQAPVETTVSADTRAGLTYDAATGVYTYVWKTDRALAGQCGTLDLGLNDGSSASAIFQFTR